MCSFDSLFAFSLVLLLAWLRTLNFIHIDKNSLHVIGANLNPLPKSATAFSPVQHRDV